MIGHSAIRVNGEIEIGGDGEQLFKYPMTRRMIRKEWAAILGSYGDKVNATADVVGGRKAERFTVEWHRKTLARDSGFVEAVLVGRRVPRIELTGRSRTGRAKSPAPTEPDHRGMNA